MKRLIPALLAAALAGPARADLAQVVDARVHCDAARECRVDVSVRHDDQGWPHYADKWDVLAADGRVLGTRALLHPHDNEQPFTRSLLVSIPPGISEVRIRAHDKVHGYGGAELTLPVP